MRSTFQRHSNIALGIAYLVLLITLSWVNSQALSVEAAVPLDKPGLIIRVLREWGSRFGGSFSDFSPAAGLKSG